MYIDINGNNSNVSYEYYSPISLSFLYDIELFSLMYSSSIIFYNQLSLETKNLPSFKLFLLENYNDKQKIEEYLINNLYLSINILDLKYIKENILYPIRKSKMNWINKYIEKGIIFRNTNISKYNIGKISISDINNKKQEISKSLKWII